MKVNLKIQINENYHLQCSILNKKGKEIIIKLSNSSQKEYIPCITFNTNTIDICKHSEISINFIKQWFDNPNDYTMYTVVFQNKTYQLLPEVLFAIIINEFKKVVEKEFIIQNTQIQIPS